MKFPWSSGPKPQATPDAASAGHELPDFIEAEVLEARAEAEHPMRSGLFQDRRAAPAAPEVTAAPKKRGLFARKSKPAGEDVTEVEARPASQFADSALADEPTAADTSAADTVQPEAGAAVAAAAPAKKASWFKRGKKAAPEASAVDGADPKPKKAKKKVRLPKTVELPVQVVIGFLPEVSARDATEYAMGVAEKHFTQPGLTFYFVTEYDNGFAYEVHEGGEGKAFLPSIINYFESHGPYHPEEHVSAVIATATRYLEVLRQRNGMVGLVLPESTEKEQSDWLAATKPMAPVINRQRNFFIAGLVVFVTGVLAMGSTAIFFRLQGYLPPQPPKVETISVNDLPRSQWRRIEALPGDAAIKALRFKNDKWQDIELETPAPAAEAPAAAAPAGAASGPAAAVAGRTEAPTTSPMKATPR